MPVSSSVRPLLAAAVLASALLAASASAQQGGAGMAIRLQGGWVTVARVLAGSPAERAGVREGDRIVRVDNRSTRLQSLTTVVAWIRGTPGTQLVLHVQRLKPDGGYSTQIRRLRLVREALPQLAL